MTEHIQKINIECPNCHFTRNLAISVFPKTPFSATCPKCKTRFQPEIPISFNPSNDGSKINGDNKNSNSRKTKPSDVAGTISSPATSKLPFAVLDLRKTILLAVFVTIFFLFVGRPYLYTYQGFDTKLIKNGQCADRSCNEIIGGAPASEVPVLVVGTIRARQRLYWGDGSNSGKVVKRITYYTYTDSLGNLHLPSKIALKFVWGNILNRYEDGTDFIVLGNDIRQAKSAGHLYCSDRPELIALCNSEDANPLKWKDRKLHN